jgi:hypothetical protein
LCERTGDVAVMVDGLGHPRVATRQHAEIDKPDVEAVVPTPMGTAANLVSGSSPARRSFG